MASIVNLPTLKKRLSTRVAVFSALFVVPVLALAATTAQPAHALTIKIGSLVFTTNPASVNTTPAPTPTPTPTTTPTPSNQMSLANRQFVDATVAATMSATKTPGTEISITSPTFGNYTQTYGYSYAAGKTPMSVSDHFRIGSVTKTFTQTAILQLIEQGKLKLSDTLNKFVPAVPNSSQITIQDMLMMRSGVYDYQSSPLVQLTFTLWPTAPFTPASAIALIETHASQFTPGTSYQYTNSNYVLLGQVIQKLTGQAPETYITNNVIKPLGLTNTSFLTGNQLPPAPYSHGYGTNVIFGNLQDETAINADLFSTAGAIQSTIGDMNKYGQAMMNGAALTPASQTLRETTFCPVAYTSGAGPSQFGYGLGFINMGTWYGHDGSEPGFSTEVMFDPATGTVIAGMENNQTANLTILSKTFEQIAAHLEPASMNTPTYPKC